jgi:hypothetical protein
MANHKVYAAIIQAIKNSELKEPFGQAEFRRACPGLGEGTYKAFLYKQRKGNPGGATELFDMVASAEFRLLRPFMYDR